MLVISFHLDNLFAMTRPVMLVVLAALFALAGYYLWREWRIDACSDGGGEWNHSAGFCGSRSG
ncbi:MAG: hypothetical protein AB7O91_08910 [Sphingomonas sp.]